MEIGYEIMFALTYFCERLVVVWIDEYLRVFLSFSSKQKWFWDFIFVAIIYVYYSLTRNEDVWAEWPIFSHRINNPVQCSITLLK